MGGIISAPTLFSLLNACQGRNAGSDPIDYSLHFFTQEQFEMVAEIAELIIPATDTPGAKEAKVNEFIDLMLADCYYEKDQQNFVAGLERLQNESKIQYQKPFMQLSPQQQSSLLKQEAGQDPNGPGRFFRIMKELTLLGYYTSEAGATKALAYVAIPGRFEGCVPLREGQKAWAI